MKKKYTPEGKPYLISTDPNTEGLSLAIISYLHLVEEPHKLTTDERLWEAALLYLEHCDKNSDIFKRTFLGSNSTQEEDIEYNFKEAISAIMKHISVKEKKVILNWGNTYKTKNNILVRETKDGKYISLKFFTKGIIMSIKDYNNFMNELGIQLEDMTMVQFNRLEDNIRITMGEDKYFDKYKTLRCFTESLITEKQLKTNTAVSNRKYNIDRGFYIDNDFNEISSIFTIL